MMPKIQIQTEGTRSILKINEIDLSDCVTKIEYIHEGREIPVVRLTFLPDSVTVDSPAKIQITDSMQMMFEAINPAAVKAAGNATE